MKKIIPNGSRLLVMPIKEVETTTKSGLIIQSDKDRESPTFGTILERGKGVENDDLNSGVKVMFEKHAGAPVKIENEDYLILDEDDILAAYEE